jgi:hypothetical protein
MVLLPSHKATTIKLVEVLQHFTTDHMVATSSCFLVTRDMAFTTSNFSNVTLSSMKVEALL